MRDPIAKVNSASGQYARSVDETIECAEDLISALKKAKLAPNCFTEACDARVALEGAMRSANRYLSDWVVASMEAWVDLQGEPYDWDAKRPA